MKSALTNAIIEALMAQPANFSSLEAYALVPSLAPAPVADSLNTISQSLHFPLTIVPREVAIVQALGRQVATCVSVSPREIHLVPVVHGAALPHQALSVPYAVEADAADGMAIVIEAMDSLSERYGRRVSHLQADVRHGLSTWVWPIGESAWDATRAAVLGAQHVVVNDACGWMGVAGRVSRPRP